MSSKQTNKQINKSSLNYFVPLASSCITQVAAGLFLWAWDQSFHPKLGSFVPSKQSHSLATTIEDYYKIVLC